GPSERFVNAARERPPRWELHERRGRAEGEIAAESVERVEDALARALVERLVVQVDGRSAQRDFVHVRRFLRDLPRRAERAELMADVEDAMSGCAEARHQLLRALKTKVPVDDRQADDVVLVFDFRRERLFAGDRAARRRRVARREKRIDQSLLRGPQPLNASNTGHASDAREERTQKTRPLPHSELRRKLAADLIGAAAGALLLVIHECSWGRAG